MKEVPEYEKDLSSIRQIMERSVKFISLSGLSGVLAGFYALAGAVSAYFILQYPLSPFNYRQASVSESDVIPKLLLIAGLVLIASIGTGIVMSARKAKAQGVSLWNATSKRLMIDLLIPLITGGIFILILLSAGHYGIAAPASLIFYGLALLHVSKHTFVEIRFLGFSEIVLGLISAAIPGYGLIFWAMGFGVLHIIYGAVMHYRYDQ
jgi:predicted lysophospholipase L1 biosynthesis ABC-type transport system permease subunit